MRCASIRGVIREINKQQSPAGKNYKLLEVTHESNETIIDSCRRRSSLCVVRMQRPEIFGTDVEQKAKDLMETTKSYTMEQKQAYEQELSKKLDAYSQEIAAFKGQMLQAKGAVQADMQVAIDKLQAMVDNMRSRADELKDASGEAWDDMKKGVDKAEDELDQAFSNAMQKFKQTTSKY
jgi:hypothetical protein